MSDPRRIRPRWDASRRARALFVLVAAVLSAPAPAGASSSPARGDAERGRLLFAVDCVRCHGSNGVGVTSPAPSRGLGPSLRGVGALAADFYLRTGYMPLRSPGDQPTRSRPAYSPAQIDDLVAYVASLGPGPVVPEPHPARGRLSEGLTLFTERCAGCHQVLGEGGVVTGARVPPLHRATPTQIAEAVRIGPYLMPRFSRAEISDAQLDSLIRYVLYARDPEDAGGLGIGHLGPIPEGMVTWLVAVVVLLGVSVVIGRRLRS